MNKKNLIEKRNEEFSKMNKFSKLIYDEVDYISGYCMDQYVDFDKAELCDLRLISKNIKILSLAITLSFLEYANLKNLKTDIVDDFEFYVKSLNTAKEVQIKHVLNKIKDIEKELHKATTLKEKESPLENWKDNWENLIRKILFIPNEKYAFRNGRTKTAMTIGAETFFYEYRLIDDFINHVDKMKKFILVESGKH
ncbi:MAG: hypothetical protein ACQEP3_01840 [Patescibacteria group bacterium]